MGIIIEGNVMGDIISNGGVKNETHYHYGHESMDNREERHDSQPKESQNSGHVPILFASRQEILNQLLDLADKGEWTNGATAEDVKTMLQQVLEKSEVMWQLLERGRGDRLRVVWQNLIGYFVDRRLLPTSIGAPALNKIFFGDDAGYTNIDKGRPSKGLMTADFESLVPQLDKYVPKVDERLKG